MQTLQEMMAAKAELEAQIAAKREADAAVRLAAIADMKIKCAEMGIVARDLFEPVKVEPTHRGPSGETWTGRGILPKWLEKLEAEGHSRDSFKIA